ncbi:MAG TPA: large-conductance mechanosensitive channel protein MscL [Deltaproteobacteria bacterium]|jgi:large conductance mechanosensitive channel|nr:large-conductance mechanosensitive channel protein MscL [Deltaproteobacteria bacterium]HOI05679.1 large-conductance mechanosensitive channel protein MscL [Deltaproteobacteria bacterium]
MGFMKEFKEFAVKGNAMDMAVGIIIGAAFGKIVSSLVADVIMPPIGAIIGGVDFTSLVLTLSTGNMGMPPVVLSYGKFIQAVVDFTIIAMAVFLLVKGINMVRKPEPKDDPGPPKEEVLLTEIRDLLKERR